MDFVDVFNACMMAYDKLQKVNDPNLFFSSIGLIVDMWSADHDLDAKEAHSYLNGLLNAHKDINEMLGGMKKTGAYED